MQENLQAIYDGVISGDATAVETQVQAALDAGVSARSILDDALVTAMAPVGVVAIGTVQGDLHDIGKNLVGMMLEGAGFEIMDLGVNVAPAKFVEAVNEGAQMLALSALLTTTMPNMKAVVTGLEQAGVRDKVKVLVGGAPVTEAFAQQIGADGYAKDASQAATLAKGMVG